MKVSEKMKNTELFRELPEIIKVETNLHRDLMSTSELGEALKNWQGSVYVLYGKSQKLVGRAIVNFTKSGRTAALPAQ